MQNATVTSGQKAAIEKVAVASFRKGIKQELNVLAKSGVLNKENVQRLLAQGNVVAKAATLAVKEKMLELAETLVGQLKLILADKEISISAVDGKETLAGAKDVFAYIDSDFKNYGCDVSGAPSRDTKVQAYEMIKDGTFKELFGGFGENLDRLCLTQSQIKSFVKNHADSLRTDGYGTFFLFKVGEKYFVAYVSRRSDGWHVHVYPLSHFGDDDVWDAERRHRIVVPQL